LQFEELLIGVNQPLIVKAEFNLAKHQRQAVLKMLLDQSVIRKLEGVIDSQASDDLLCELETLRRNLRRIFFMQGQIISRSDVLVEGIWNPEGLKD